MDGRDRDDIDEMDDDEYEEQVEQLIVENGMLVNTLAALLVKKGVLTEEEINNQMRELYPEELEEDDA